VLPPELKKFYRKVELFFIVTDMGIEARRALTQCQKSGQGFMGTPYLIRN